MNTTTHPHVDLVHRILAGDSDAEAQLYNQLERPIYLMLMQRCGNSETARDVLHDAFIVLILRLRKKELDQPENLLAFARATALNVWIGLARKESRRDTHPDTEAIATMMDENTHLQDVEVERDERRVLVGEILDELPVERDREILRRTYIYGQDKNLVCEQLELSQEHFDRVIHRAKQRFRKLIEERQALVT